MIPPSVPSDVPSAAEHPASGLMQLAGVGAGTGSAATHPASTAEHDPVGDRDRKRPADRHGAVLGPRIGPGTNGVRGRSPRDGPCTGLTRPP